MSELINCEIVLKTVISEFVSESMPDDVLTWGDSGGGKAKSGMMGIGNLSAHRGLKKIIVLRLKTCGI